jgi:hypothetical protein
MSILMPGSLVIVATEGGKPGTVKHVTTDGYVAVLLVNEGRAWHEWPADMVKAATPKEAAEASRKFLPPKFFAPNEEE